MARAAGRMRGVYAEPPVNTRRRLPKMKLELRRRHPSSVGSADTFSRKGRRDLWLLPFDARLPRRYGAPSTRFVYAWVRHDRLVRLDG